jgi:hypothetical protein
MSEQDRVSSCDGAGAGTAGSRTDCSSRGEQLGSAATAGHLRGGDCSALVVDTTSSPGDGSGALSLGPACDATKYRALVVGMSQYRHLPTLESGRDPAQAVARQLADEGYAVLLIMDADRTSFQAALGAFLPSLMADCRVVFHFSGHGVSCEDGTYLVPVDGEVSCTGGESATCLSSMWCVVRCLGCILWCVGGTANSQM